MLRQIQMLKIVLNSINCECHIKGMTLLPQTPSILRLVQLEFDAVL